MATTVRFSISVFSPVACFPYFALLADGMQIYLTPYTYFHQNQVARRSVHQLEITSANDQIKTQPHPHHFAFMSQMIFFNFSTLSAENLTFVLEFFLHEFFSLMAKKQAWSRVYTGQGTVP